MEHRKLWAALSLVLIGSFAVLGYFGREIYRQAPPVPERVVSETGAQLFSGQDIKDGQNVWQSMGGQQVGSIWGHGAYVAPDWSADWLHRECALRLDLWSMAAHGKRFADLGVDAKVPLQVKLAREMRRNTYDS